MIPIASITAKKLGRRMGKVATEAQEKSGDLNKYLIDLFKNHKVIKIFQRENFENKRSEKFVDDLKKKSTKIATVFIRATPIMEILTGIMIAILIFYSGKLIMNGQLNINNFFSFLAAMMLAYQPVRSLATLNVVIQQGLSGARKVLPIIDGDLATVMPHSSIFFILSSAPPFPPDIIAPACPILLPGGAVIPAMKPTMGFLIL